MRLPPEPSTLHISLISSAVVLATGLAFSLLPLAAVENWSVEHLLPRPKIYGSKEDPDPKIATCTIERKNYVGRALPRDHIARLVRQLDALGAKVIVSTILFSSPEEPSASQPGDEDLAKEFAALGDRIVLPFRCLAASDQARGVDPQVLGDAAIQSTFEEYPFKEYTHIRWNQKLLTKNVKYQAAECIMEPERPRLVISHRERYFPTLALRAVERAWAQDRDPPADGLTIKPSRLANDLPRLRIFEQPIAISSEGRVRVNYREDSFKTTTMSDVLGGKVDADFFRGRIVFVGVRDRSKEPFVNTPGGPKPRVEVWANVASSILRGDYIRDGTVSSSLLSLAALLGLGLVAPVLVYRSFKELRIFAALAILLLLFWLLVCCLALRVGIHLLIFPPILSGSLTFGIVFGLLVYLDREKLRREKERIEDERQRIQYEYDAWLTSVDDVLRADAFNDWLEHADASLALVFNSTVGASEKAATLNAESTESPQAAHSAQVRSLVRKHGGHQLRRHQRGWLSVFRTAAKALDFAVDLQADSGHPLIAVRANIHVGKVQRRETIELTCRMEGRAAGSEIWLSDEAKREVEHYSASWHEELTWSEHRNGTLQGFAGRSLTLWSVTTPYMQRAAHRVAAADNDSLLGHKSAMGHFDVFLCYNREDRPAVRRIARQLLARGMLPWLDEWELRPGFPPDELERVIEIAASAAVFVGEAALRPWKLMIYRALLEQFVERDCPVIPVLLEHAPRKPELPLFLRQFTWVKFRSPEPDPLDALIWGITGKKPFDAAAAA